MRTFQLWAFKGVSTCTLRGSGRTAPRRASAATLTGGKNLRFAPAKWSALNRRAISPKRCLPPQHGRLFGSLAGAVLPTYAWQRLMPRLPSPALICDSADGLNAFQLMCARMVSLGFVVLDRYDTICACAAPAQSPVSRVHAHEPREFTDTEGSLRRTRVGSRRLWVHQLGKARNAANRSRCRRRSTLERQSAPFSCRAIYGDGHEHLHGFRGSLG